MRGGRRSVASLGAVVVFLACSGDRGSSAPATGGQVADTVATASADSAAADTTRDSTSVRVTPPPVRDTAPDPASVRVTPPARRDTAPAGRAVVPPAPRRAAAAKPPASKPAAAPPTAAASPPPIAAPAALPADTPPAGAAPVAGTGAPLRDAYHQAPRDTVTPEVYDGWKQFNLNCARCHGEDVLGTTIAPHLIVSVRPGGPVDTKEAFVQTVCAGRPEKGMPAWCPLGLEMDKINAIYQYVKGRSEGKIAPGRPARRE